MARWESTSRALAVDTNVLRLPIDRTAEDEPELVISGSGIVGVAFSPSGSAIVATHVGSDDLVRTEAYGGVPVSWTTHRWQPEQLTALEWGDHLPFAHEPRVVVLKPEDVQGSGDVKYHLGTSTDVDVAGHSVHLSLQPNPSHLEAVDPVVVGKVRARQDMAGDTRRRSVMGILMHGDAAFAGRSCGLAAGAGLASPR